ncbi:hypothetical protein N431DRAFT_482803 [Stipitochalara longipes BDJ]|nr:hypothetical protein N431DRAFT_482803 [Stipitochalara longipes BDJ]
MGKGKGKKGKKEPKSVVKKATVISKVPREPRPVNPVKKAKKLLSKEKKAAMTANPLGSDPNSIAMAASNRVMKNLLHAKWPALFKKHLGVIESHIKALDRTMQSMKSEMAQMPEKERMEWELGERGNWRVLCEMMDRARQVLADARKSAQGILPPEKLRDKKGLGVTGTEFEPLGPKLAQRAAELGYTKRGKLGRDPDAISTDSDDDTEMSDSSSSDDDDAATNGADFVPLNIGAKVPRFPIVEEAGEDKEQKTTTNGVEPNPYFVVDTNPTPVVFNGNGLVKMSNKRAKEDNDEGKESKKPKKEKHAVTEAAESLSVEPEVDFAALEAALQAEVEAAEAAKAREAQSAGLVEDKKSKKKRRRSSDGVELVEKKKVKKERPEKLEHASAGIAAEPSVPAEETTAKESGKKRKLSEAASGDEVIEKKVKKEKRDKKRKADANEAESDEGKTKKRKQKIGTGSE